MTSESSTQPPIPLTSDQVNSIAQKYKLTYIAVFGSTARNELTNDSDLDVLVDYDGVKTLFDLAEIRDELEHIAATEVDLVVRRNLKPAIKESIQPDLITLYESPSEEQA